MFIAVIIESLWLYFVCALSDARYEKFAEKSVSGCANDHSDTFDLWYPQESSGHTLQLHNELQDGSVLRSPLQTVTIPNGTVILLELNTEKLNDQLADACLLASHRM